MASIIQLKDESGVDAYPVTGTSMVVGLDDALSAKQATLVSGTNIKTVNSQSLLGSGDITISPGSDGPLIIHATLLSGSIRNDDNISAAVAVAALEEGRDVLLITIASDNRRRRFPAYTWSAQTGQQFVTFLKSKDDDSMSYTLSNSEISDDCSLDCFEKTTNKVTSLSSSSTNTQYPSAKCVYDAIQDEVAGKADKSEMSVSTSGDQTTITLKSGTNATVINSHQSLSGKQDTLVSGTNIKTINGSSVLGSGNLSTLTPIVNHGTSDTTFELTPNVWHTWGTISALTLTLGTPSDNTVVNLYMFEFTSGSTATTLSMPSVIIWEGGVAPTIDVSTKYEITIQNNCAKFSAFPIN